MEKSNAVFVKSAADAGGFIADGLPAVIFAGRSNAGKSSLINALLSRKSLAKVGAAPGKTTHVNYFLISPASNQTGEFYFADLPGYGYAKRSFDERERWARLMDDFFAHRQVQDKSLGLLVIDARHGPLESDMKMAEYFRGYGMPFVVAANKADKLKKSEVVSREQEIKKAFLGLCDDIFLCSSVSGIGIRELGEKIHTAL